MMPHSVTTLKNTSLEEVVNEMKNRKTLLIKNWDIGPCVDTWNCDYVSSKVGNEPVKIHVTQNEKMDFVKKNFLYKTLPFDELINRIFRSRQENGFFIHPEEKYYLRSLGSDHRGKHVANFVEQYKILAGDLKLPPFFDENNFFSSVFRASSSGIQLWTHYDIMDNILIQIRGRKKIVLWPPSEMEKLYMIGDKSQVLEIDNPDAENFPKFKDAFRYECVMNPGDILYIPALWFHNTLALEPSLAVNVFWKNLSHELYDKNDTYGNKDLVPGTKALNSVNSAIKSLSNLPTEYRKFYIQRVIEQLKVHLAGDTTEVS